MTALDEAPGTGCHRPGRVRQLVLGRIRAFFLGHHCGGRSPSAQFAIATVTHTRNVSAEHPSTSLKIY